MENNYTVYIHINKINNKKYIGITSQKVENRWRNGEGYQECIYFKNAIDKYGWDNFKHIILFTGLNKDEANNYEILLIELFQSNNRDKGYNLTSGGGGIKGIKMSEDTKKKMSESHKGVKHPLYNKNRTDEVKLKISETKKKSDNNKRGNNPKARKIICLNTKEIFNCIRDASEKYFITEANITQCLSREQKYSGLHPITKEKMVWMYYKDYIMKTDNQINEILYFNEFKKVKCLNTNEIFNSALDASNKYNIEISSIRKCCRNTLKSAGKHPENNLPMIWEYVA